MATDFTQRVLKIINNIPVGKVMTYGKIALHGGNSRGARQVSRILHTCSKKEKLPWHRVVNRDGMISLPEKGGYEEQRTLLNEEGVLSDTRNRIELKIFLWEP